MKDAIDSVGKIFSHLARDIQNYLITGLIVLFNLYFLDQRLMKGELTDHFSDLEYRVAGILIAAYVTGHICLGVYTITLELTRLDFWLAKVFFSRRYDQLANGSGSYKDFVVKKRKIFLCNLNLYMHFVERNVNLATMRWNYSAAFFISFLIDVICGWNKHDSTVVYVGVLALLVSFILLILYVITEKECTADVKVLSE